MVNLLLATLLRKSKQMNILSTDSLLPLRYAAPTIPARALPLDARPDARPRSLAALARDEIRARSLRANFVDASLFTDPWDMLLELFAAEHEHRKVAISELAFATNTAPTTSLRWLNALIEKGLVERNADPHDGRRSFVRLTCLGTEAMTQYFQARSFHY